MAESGLLWLTYCYRNTVTAGSCKAICREMGEIIMDLSAPTQPVFLIALVVGVLAIISLLGVTIPVIAPYALWLLIAAFVLLVLGNVLRGL